MNGINVRVVEDAPKMGRVLRNPQHPFSLKVRPWQIQPCMIAPVLPGETMQNLLLQSRLVSNPVKSSLVGWWAEYYFFYVKHRDLDQEALLTNMHMVPTTDMTSFRAGAQSLPYYTFNGGLNYVEACLKRVTECFFRDEEDGAWNAKLIDTLPIAHINKFHAFESLRDQSLANEVENHELPGEVTPSPFGMDPAFATYYQQWENMRALKMTAATFEDWLASWGVKTPEVNEDENRVELIRYIKEWTYPTNTINPADGAPSAALSWSVQERADKARMFKEPGFVFGVQVVRPKVYFSVQKGAAVGAMDNAYAWLPPTLVDQAWTSLKNHAFGAGPLAGANATGGYWWDIRDLFVFGDQYVNYDIAAAGDGSHVVMPAAGYSSRYATAAMADALFKTALNNKIVSDGVVSLSIKGMVVNQT